jgi:hypothetical protein
MKRPVAGVSALTAGATVIGFLLAGCSARSGVVIGVPNTAPTVAPVPSSLDNAINQAITNELYQVNVNQSTATESASLAAELNALNSDRSLVRSEAIAALVATGAKQIARREGSIAKLIAEVEADKYLGGVDVAGRSLSRSLVSILGGVRSQLAALANKIATDQLADELRTDILSIGTSTRIYGVFEPMIHLAIAAGDELSELSVLAGQEQQLSAEVASGQGTDTHYTAEAATLRDLAASISSGRAIVDSAVGAALSMTPSEYPANKATIVAVRSALIEMRSPLGKIGRAAADVNLIIEFLAKR